MDPLDTTIVANEAYRDAVYQYLFTDDDGHAHTEILPVRGNLIVNGKIVPIPPFITLREAILQRFNARN